MAEPKDEIEVSFDDEVMKAKYRTFSSGKKGYGAYGLIKIGDRSYRVSLNLIEVA